MRSLQRTIPRKSCRGADDDLVAITVYLDRISSLELSAENDNVLWVPAGFAHGFMTLEEDSVTLYFCSEEWNPTGEGGLLWSDPALKIGWPALQPLVSAKDRQNFTLTRWLADERSKAFIFG